jgi:hypothetical protein
MHDRTTQEQDDTYLHTIERLEPDIHIIDAGAGWASCAISLNRIATTLEELLMLLQASARTQPLLPSRSSSV